MKYLLFLFISVSAFEVYKISDFAFFDPVKNTKCNETNYWTPFNQNTTCYRFVNLVLDDTNKKGLIKIMLDHNAYVSSGNDLQNTLAKIKKQWKRFDGNISIIDEKTLINLYGLEEKPSITKPIINPKYKLTYYYMNSIYIINQNKTDENGYWTSTAYNKDYMFCLDGVSRNILCSKSKIMGVRPVITIRKSLLVKSKPFIDITNKIKKGKVHKFKHESKKYDGYIYNQLQGFTMTEDKLIYYMVNKENHNKGVLYAYKNWNKKVYSQYVPYGHGNGMEYIPSKKHILMTTNGELKKLIQLNKDTLKLEKEFKTSDGYLNFASIAYDNVNKVYFMRNGYKLIVTKDLKTIIHQFDYPTFQSLQDLVYKDGYLYCIASETSHDAQKYIIYGRHSNLIYVYNFKMNKNLIPNKNFGKLEYTLFQSNKGKFGELEDVAIRNNTMVFGFASLHEDKDYALKFYEVDFKKIKDDIIPYKVYKL